MIGTPGGTPERPATFFAGPEEFRAWLAENHATATELWMGLYKKHVPERGLTWEDAVLEALCYGWIDSVAQRIDEDAVRQRWTPRKRGSNWSRINIASVERLITQGRMQASGLAAYEQRTDGRSGVYSYEAGGNELSAEFEALLRADAVAAAFWDAATPSYRRGCANWVMSAKQDATRRKRLAQLIEDSAHGRLVPPQRYGEQPKWLDRAASAARAAASR